MNTDTAVMVRDLRKSYPDVTAVDGIDLDIARGEVFALLGPNGAGKTTTVEILEGFRQRDRGTVEVLGHDPAHGGRAWRARIGIVLQLASAGPELTVLEMVRHFASFYPCPREPEEAIELVGLTDKARSRIASLSGGLTRRLDVALGIVGRPELLFLDEPTTGFDPEARRQFWELIRGLRTDGTTILLTTHYLDEAEALADRIAIIASGRIVASGDPASLGGRATADVHVSWDEPGAPGRTTEKTPTPTRLVTELTARFGGEVIEQSLERAALISQLESTRAELAAAHHEKGVLAERHRLAGEIHDTLAQGFTSIVTLVQAAEASLPPGAVAARHHLDLALATARENLAEARTLVAALSPASLESASLAEAVRRVAESTGAEAGIQANSEVTGTARRLPMGTEVVLLRVCQEALANVRKHAAAHEVAVRLCYADGVVRLTVADDGAGFDSELITSGYGLRGMRDRVAQIGGTIQVTSAPGTGTQVSAEVPG